jgi:hypothetical protein
MNGVCFGNYRVNAKVARFDRSDGEVLAREGEGEGVEPKGMVKKVGREGEKSSDEGVKNQSDVAGMGQSVVVVDDDVTVEQGVVRVGKVRVRLDKGNDRAVVVRKGVSAEKGMNLHQGSRGQVERQPSIQKLLRMYRSCEEDLHWARNGYFATVIQGEAIPVIQSKIEDAGFSDIDVIPLGADIVFTYSSTGMDVSSLLEGASDLFSHFLSNIRRWGKSLVPFQRGAWVRMYGVLIHAWNVTFFKLCVVDCGRFLWSDSCSVDKDRFDYARVLIATSSLDVVNCVEKLVVDGVIVEIKIIEEWGFNMGKDACLFDHDDGTQPSQSDHGDIDGDADPYCVNADCLVDKIVNDLVDDVKEAQQETEEGGKNLVENKNDKVVQQNCITEEVCQHKELTSELVVEQSDVGSVKCFTCSDFCCEQPLANADARAADEDSHVSVSDVSLKPSRKSIRRRNHTSSCPARAVCSLKSGPWSLEWLSDQHHGDAGVISSSRKKSKKVMRPGDPCNQVGFVDKKRKKVDGVLRHFVHSLKKVARLPCKDRSNVLKILKKKVRKRQGSNRLKKAVDVVSHRNSNSSCSIGSENNDWSHRVVVHGNEKVAVEEVWGIGKVIGVNFNGDTHNMFEVLARKGKGMGEARRQKGVDGGASIGGGC